MALSIIFGLAGYF